MTCERRIQFEGNDGAYIRFLEARIFELESTLERSLPQTSHIRSSHYPENHGDSSRVDNMCRVTNNSRRQTSSESENSAHGDLDGGTRLAFARRGGHQGSQDYNDARGNSLEIIEYNPSRDTNLHLKKRKENARSQSAQGRLQMLSNFTSFISDLPESKTWKEWVSVSDFERETILRGLVQGFAPSEGLKILPSRTSKSTQISILRDYGNSMKTSRTTNKQLACFRELIFCSLCAVALRSAESKDDVYETMREVLGSDAYSKRFEALVRGAKWVNHAISLLSHTGWGLRSWDIILLGM
jgi:hypothetical protein